MSEDIASALLGVKRLPKDNRNSTIPVPPLPSSMPVLSNVRKKQQQFPPGAVTCQSCRDSKVKCDRQSPCSRCVRLSCPCIPTGPSNRGKRRKKNSSGGSGAVSPVPAALPPPTYTGPPPPLPFAVNTSLYAAGGGIPHNVTVPLAVHHHQQKQYHQHLSEQEAVSSSSSFHRGNSPPPAAADAFALTCASALSGMTHVNDHHGVKTLSNYSSNSGVSGGIASHPPSMQLSGKKFLPPGTSPVLVGSDNLNNSDPTDNNNNNNARDYDEVQVSTQAKEVGFGFPDQSADATSCENVIIQAVLDQRNNIQGTGLSTADLKEELSPHLRMVKIWVQIAFRRRSCKLLTKALALAQSIGVTSLDEIFGVGTGLSNDLDMSFLPSIMMLPKEQQVTIGSQMKYDEIPKRLLKLMHLDFLTPSCDNNTWVIGRGMRNGQIRFFTSPSFERDIVSWEHVYKTYTANEVSVPSTFCPEGEIKAWLYQVGSRMSMPFDEHNTKKMTCVRSKVKCVNAGNQIVEVCLSVTSQLIFEGEKTVGCFCLYRLTKLDQLTDFRRALIRSGVVDKTCFAASAAAESPALERKTTTNRMEKTEQQQQAGARAHKKFSVPRMSASPALIMSSGSSDVSSSEPQEEIGDYELENWITSFDDLLEPSSDESIWPSLDETIIDLLTNAPSGSAEGF